ncbi:hypothetical protein L1987_09612 [Smallanthus sonchifolius]|uniref:Uncharacterized protein n=1 Tax=Smallanthus sonchifolius TaxID=185202 RepID=A0ACB9JPR5_9ASTR|nr:hypothetical protein L1987_09612 [Smallanthus sonchifolius]
MFYVKVLCSSGVAPLDEKTSKALEDKHPCMPPPTMPAFLPTDPPLVVETDSVLVCIKSFPKGTSCGRDGLRAQHLLDALCGEGSVIAASLLRAIAAMVNLCLRGGCPRSLAEFVASAPLTPLLKPDNGIRPIAVGSIWRRVVSKVAMKGVGRDMAKYLGDFQFGVGVPNGAETVLHSANRFVNAHHRDGSLAMLTVDFSNAFNLVDRTALLNEVRKMCPSISAWVDFLYGQPARLYVGNDYIWSSTGVQQGDPLGPLLFALVLHPLVLRIRDRCKLLFHAWYLDDGTLIGDATQVAKALDIIRVEGPSLGLLVNIKKTEVFWPTCDGVKTRESLFPREIGRPVHGVKLLGGAVSRDGEFISGLALKRAKRAVDLMGCLKRLRNPQSELLLLRSCMGVAKLLFGLRTCQPSYVGEAVSVFDTGLRKTIEDIVVCGGAFFGDLQWRLASLPTRFGGLGICSAGDASSYAFVASRAQSWVLQDHILRECGGGLFDSDYRSALDTLHSSLPDLDIDGFYIKDTAPLKAQKILANALYSEIVKTFEEKFALSPRQRAVLECLRAPHAQDFLSVVPIEGLGQCMSPVEYRAILKYRLMVPLFPVDDPCPVCRKACLDSFGEHAVHCRELPGFKYRHDLVRDVLFDVLKRAGISAKKEAPVNFLTDPLDGRSTLRPADILVFGWEGGKHACVDLTGVSPLVGLRDNGFKVGQAINKAEAGKVAKHEKACLVNQHVFVPFAFDTFGALAPDAVRFLKRVQRVVSSNTAYIYGGNFVFSRVGFAIQKGVAAQLVARLPAISTLFVVVAFSNNLTGEIPRSLQRCNKLHTIQLYDNSFTGEFPSGIWSLSNLSSLRISGNFLSGELPSSLAWNLSRLEISDNKFSGLIPEGISSWKKLNVFKASNNLLLGEIPTGFTNLSQLSVLYLDGNSLSGELPSTIRSWNSLTTLNLARNNLSGPIPPAITSLPHLLDLDLSENQFSGKIPPEFSRLRLTTLNLSSNKLTGRVPYAFDNLAYENSFLNNPNLCASSPIPNLHNCYATYTKSSHSNKFSPNIIAMIVVLSAFVILVAILCTLFMFRGYLKKKQKRDLTTWKLTSFHTLKFTEANILCCLTDNNLIGSGGSGKVYQIEIGRHGEYVAVKRIWNTRKIDHTLEKEFLSEVQILGSIRHSNIVKLLCCFSSEDSKLLVYEYMENQSLDKWLHGKKMKTNRGLVHHMVLDWPRRLQIAIGAAQGLCYMHHDCSPPIIHRDVKSSNILLDSEFKARIADFGLAKILTKLKPGQANTLSAIAGSFGYIPPEYAYSTTITERVDVYSFGVVLLEIVTGKEPHKGDGEMNLAQWTWKHFSEGKSMVEALDPEIKQANCYMEEISLVFKLGLICTSTLPSSRPSMKEVLEILRRCDTPLSEERKVGDEIDVTPLLVRESYLSNYRRGGNKVANESIDILDGRL